MRIVFYCPTEIKEIKEIFVPLCEALSAISAISVGHYYLMRIVFYCPAVIGFAASLVEEIKEIKEILLPARCAALSAISAISAGRLLPHADSVLLSRFLLSRRNEGNKGNLCSDARGLSAISAGHYYLMRIVPQI